MVISRTTWRISRGLTHLRAQCMIFGMRRVPGIRHGPMELVERCRLRVLRCGNNAINALVYRLFNCIANSGSDRCKGINKVMGPVSNYLN
jgi:hypothetical protein